MGMCGLFQSRSSFQNAHKASDFRLLRSLEPDATMEQEQVLNPDIATVSCIGLSPTICIDKILVQLF